MLTRHIFPRSPDDAGGASADPAASPTAGGGEPAPVPYREFKAANEAANAAKADAVAARAEAAAVVAERAAWATERETLAKTSAALTRDLGLAKVGVVDADHVAALELAHRMLPEAGRPATEADLWAGIRAGTIVAPRSLAGFLPAAASTAPAAGAARLPAATASPASAGPAAGQLAADLAAANARWSANPGDPALKARSQELSAALKLALKKT